MVNLDVHSYDIRPFYIQKTAILSNESMPVKFNYLMYRGSEHIQALIKSDVLEFR